MLGFLGSCHQVVSKSSDQKLRFWDLSRVGKADMWPWAEPCDWDPPSSLGLVSYQNNDALQVSLSGNHIVLFDATTGEPGRVLLVAPRPLLSTSEVPPAADKMEKQKSGRGGGSGGNARGKNWVKWDVVLEADQRLKGGKATSATPTTGGGSARRSSTRDKKNSHAQLVHFSALVSSSSSTSSSMFDDRALELLAVDKDANILHSRNPLQV